MNVDELRVAESLFETEVLDQLIGWVLLGVVKAEEEDDWASYITDERDLKAAKRMAKYFLGAEQYKLLKKEV